MRPSGEKIYINLLEVYRNTFRSIDLNRSDLLLILSRMVRFYRAEAYHVAVFSAVKTAQKASEALDKVCGEVRMEN